MSKLWARVAGLLGKRTLAGMDKAGNRYFARKDEIDGVMKEKRWVVFKGEEDPTSIPVEWICWLNGQRKKAPTPEEMMELEARRERVRLNVALLKKEEEERRAKQGSGQTITNTGPDLKSFIKQFPPSSEGDTVGEVSSEMDGVRNSEESETDKEVSPRQKQQPESTEPTGSGESFRPGTWQPPT